MMVFKKGVHFKGQAVDNVSGLLPIVYLCVGAKVMLTTNLNVKCGLFNGSPCTVVDILYPKKRVMSALTKKNNKYKTNQTTEKYTNIVQFCGTSNSTS
jgi:hypothetical protein